MPIRKEKLKNKLLFFCAQNSSVYLKANKKKGNYYAKTKQSL